MLRVALRHQVDVEYLLVVLLPRLGACHLMCWFTLSSREGLCTLLDGVPTSLEPCWLRVSKSSSIWAKKRADGLSLGLCCLPVKEDLRLWLVVE
jgi:hypothetical protein